MQLQPYLILFAFVQPSHFEKPDYPVELKYKDRASIGRFDRNGNFDAEYTTRSGLKFFPSSNASHVANLPTAENRYCYEYRSGILILGSINEDGSFVPALESKPLPFSEYRFFPFSPKIWNFPWVVIAKRKTTKSK